jgi:hypothetical protein
MESFHTMQEKTAPNEILWTFEKPREKPQKMDAIDLALLKKVTFI